MDAAVNSCLTLTPLSLCPTDRYHGPSRMGRYADALSAGLDDGQDSEPYG